jgi:hypothetical protein
MNNDFLIGASTITKGHVRRVGEPLGRRVECLSGVIWVTQDGDLRDIILEPGDGFDFDRSEGVLISALQDSRYLLLEGGATKRH